MLGFPLVLKELRRRSTGTEVAGNTERPLMPDVMRHSVSRERIVMLGPIETVVLTKQARRCKHHGWSTSIPMAPTYFRVRGLGLEPYCQLILLCVLQQRGRRN